MMKKLTHSRFEKMVKMHLGLVYNYILGHSQAHK